MHYEDAVIKKLIEKFELEGPAKLARKYRYGDIFVMPKSDLPLVTIAKTGTITTPASNMESEYMMSMAINVIYDFTSDLRQDRTLQAGINSVYDLIEGRDENYQLKPESLLYILQKYQVLDNNLWIMAAPNDRIETVYGIGNQRRGPGIFSVEGLIRFNVKAHLQRPGL